jgi:hypothetical protein
MNETELVQVNVTGGTPIRVEVTRLDEGSASTMDQDISSPKIPDLAQVWEMISQVSSSIGDKLAKAKAKKAVVEFGIEIGLEAGQLTAMIVKGSGKANIKITLEWS